MEGRPVRIGVIGSGFGSMVHIPGFQSEGLEVVAVCTQRKERAEKAAKEFGIPYAFDDFREMLRRTDMDAVSIAAPAPPHYEMVMAALEAGKHVLCEKPFAMRLDQAKAMLLKAQSTSLTAMASNELRFVPARAYVKELLEQGYIGELRHVTITAFIGPVKLQGTRVLHWRDQAALGGGYLRDLGSHFIDCLRVWFGEIVGASGRAFTLDPNRRVGSGVETATADADDSFSCVVSFANGGWGSISASSVAPFGSGARIEIYGTKGTLHTPQPDFYTNSDTRVFGARLGHDQQLQELPIPERFQPVVDDRDRRLAAFRLLVRRFLTGIVEGTSPSPNFYDAFRCQQVIEAVYQSSAEGRWVQIPPE